MISITTRTYFDPATEDEVLQVIASSSSTSSSNDPFPTWMLKIHVKCLLPCITKIVNESHRYGVFPDCLKSAIVCPLLKKPNLDIEDLKNYRPVSNLKFLSKVLERIVAVRLHDHLESHNLSESFQSAYKKHHGTETALLKVHNDIFQALDAKQAMFLVLLDLSSAFDTIDQGILLK